MLDPYIRSAIDRDSDDYATHDITDLEIFFRCIMMAVVANNTDQVRRRWPLSVCLCKHHCLRRAALVVIFFLWSRS